MCNYTIECAHDQIEVCFVSSGPHIGWYVGTLGRIVEQWHLLAILEQRFIGRFGFNLPLV